MNLFFRKDAGMAGFSKEVLTAMDNPDYIVYLLKKSENTIAFKGMKKSSSSSYLKDAFDVPARFYESLGDSVYGIEGAFFIGDMLGSLGIDLTFFSLPVSLAKDGNGDICLIT
jgi:hypothetical protein